MPATHGSAGINFWDVSHMLFDNKANSIRLLLIERGETLAVAESVTSGYVQAILSSAEEATLFFQGGITAYNLGQKARHLHIDPIEGEKNNCVSEAIAIQMAKGVQQLFSSDYGIAITGYAAPLPEKGITGLFAYMAITYRDRLICSRLLTSEKNAMPAAQIDYAEQVLFQFEQVLQQLAQRVTPV